MFKKLKANQYVTEHLWDDTKALAIILLVALGLGIPITLLIYHPFILG